MVLCSDCRAALASEAMASESSQTIQLAPILREALAQVQPGEDFDEALLRALKSRHPGEAAMLLPALSRLIADEAERRGGSKEEAVRRLAAAVPSAEITLRTSGQHSPTFTSTTETRVVTLGDKRYQSLEELPLDVRRAVEAGLSRGEKPKLRLGCSTALLSGLLAVLLRRG
jgi:hypothetical protein